jgi:hypothetical protein
MKKNGFLVSPEKSCRILADVSTWEVVEDSSVEDTYMSPYSWLHIEVRSPSLYFTSG